MDRSALIVGCGFVGLPLARLLSERSWQVTGSSRSPAGFAESFPITTLDLSRPETFDILSSRVFDVCVHCASSGGGGAAAYRTVFLEGVQLLLRELRIGHLIFTSSTSVYAQEAGEEVDETSAAVPMRETGQILRATEDLVLQAGGTVARLAGLYGPQRCVPLRKLLAGEATLDGAGERIMNQLHQADAAEALALLAQRAPGGIYNVADDAPVAQQDWFQWVCAQVARPLPPATPRDLQRKRGWTSKRVVNAKLRQLGWTPIYPSFREGLPELILEAGNKRARTGPA